MELVEEILGGEEGWLLGKPEVEYKIMPDLQEARLKVLEKEYLAVKEERDNLREALEDIAKYFDGKSPEAKIAQQALTRSTEKGTGVHGNDCECGHEWLEHTNDITHGCDNCYGPDDLTLCDCDKYRPKP